MGDGISEHKAYIAGSGERIEITHKLLDRRAIVATVLDVVNFLKDKNAGLFGMDAIPIQASSTGAAIKSSTPGAY